MRRPAGRAKRLSETRGVHTYRRAQDAAPLVPRIAASLETVALGIWVGALVGFVAFTPQAIRIVPIASFARFIGSDLRFLTLLGTACGVVALAALVVGSLRADDRRADAIRFVAVLVAIGLGLWGTHMIDTMDALLAAAGRPIPTLPLADPVRLRYDGLHALSTRLYGGALFCALAALAVRGFAPPASSGMR
jgi:hypothetical protein